MKFTLDVTLAARIDTTRGEGTDTPFAREMLAVEGVASVFGVGDFVTITRDAGTDWDAIVCAVEEAAAKHLGEESGDPAEDEVAAARELLRGAVAPPKSRAVEIGLPPDRDPDPHD